MAFPGSAASAQRWQNRRRFERLPLDGFVDICQGPTKIGLGSLIDMSLGGCAFRSNQELAVGGSYQLYFRGGGAATGRLLRRDDNNRYAVEFDSPKPSQGRGARAFAATTKAE